MRIPLGAALTVTTASVMLVGTSIAAAATPSQNGRAVIAGTAPVSEAAKPTTLAASTRVQLSVFVGQDQAGLAAAATAVSDPASPSYRHYLSPAQVRARFGATAAQQDAVRGWLSSSGLTVTHDDGFLISAVGTATKAEATLQTGLALSRPADGAEQVVPSRAMSVPTALASTITTIRIGTATAVTTPHQPLTASAPAVPGSTAVAASSAECSAYYGQKPATDLPKAYGRRINWAPCGYTPTQVRDAYGATRSGLTGAGTTVAVLSGYADPTALTDADQWSRQQEIPQFASGQFTEYDGSDAGGGSLDENTLDLEAVHGMAPAADVAFVVGGDEIPDDPLLDALNTVVQQHLAEVVTSSYYEHFMPAPTSMITSWESVLEQAALEGITVDTASGDFGSTQALEYPGSDPWVTSVGGTSLAIGTSNDYLWETAWESDPTSLAADGRGWPVLEPGTARNIHRGQHRRGLRDVRLALLPGRRGQREHRERRADAHRAGRVRARRPEPRRLRDRPDRGGGN